MPFKNILTVLSQSFYCGLKFERLYTGFKLKIQTLKNMSYEKEKY